MRTVASYFAMLTLVWMQFPQLSQASLLPNNQEEMRDQFSNQRISLRTPSPALKSFLVNQPPSSSSSSYYPGLVAMLHWGSVIDEAQDRLSQLFPKETNQPKSLHLLRQRALFEPMEGLTISIVPAAELDEGLGAQDELADIQADIMREPAVPGEEIDILTLQLMMLAAQQNRSRFISIDGKDEHESQFLLEDETSGAGRTDYFFKNRQAFGTPNRLGSLRALMAGPVNKRDRPLKKFNSSGYNLKEQSLQSLYEGSEPQVVLWRSFEPESDILPLLISKRKDIIIPSSSMVAGSIPVESTTSGNLIPLMPYVLGVCLHVLFLFLIL